MEFHDALSTIAIADPDPDECSTLIDVTLPEITDSPADLIALAEQVPHDDARSIFLNEAYAAFDLLGACSDGQSVAGDEFSFQHQVSDDLLNEVDG